MQALIPRQIALIPHLGRSAASAGAHSQADSVSPPSKEGVQALFPMQAALILNPGIVQGMQVLMPRQAALTPFPI